MATSSHAVTPRPYSNKFSRGPFRNAQLLCLINDSDQKRLIYRVQCCERTHFLESGASRRIKDGSFSFLGCLPTELIISQTHRVRIHTAQFPDTNLLLLAAIRVGPHSEEAVTALSRAGYVDATY